MSIDFKNLPSTFWVALKVNKTSINRLSSVQLIYGVLNGSPMQGVH